MQGKDDRIVLSASSELDPHTFYYLVGFNSMTLPASRQGMLMRELDNGAVLEAIKVPSLIIQGKDDRVVLSASSDNIARHIPHVSRVDYDHCGHVPFVEAAEQFNRDWLHLCSAFTVNHRPPTDRSLGKSETCKQRLLDSVRVRRSRADP